MDEDWPGNWEGEDEPRTEEIPGSLSVEEVQARIKEDPKKEIFRSHILGSGFILICGAMTILIIPLFIVAEINGTLYLPLLESIISFTLILAILWLIPFVIIQLETYSNKIFMSDFGVCGETSYSGRGAIEWEHIAYVEVRYNDDRFVRVVQRCEIATVVFRGNGRSVWVENRFIFGKELTLETISRYIDGFEHWQSRPKRGYCSEVVIFTNPRIEIPEEDFEDGRRPIDEFDDDIGHLTTSEAKGSVSEEELLGMIREDRSRTKYPDTRSLSVVKWMTYFITVMMAIIILATLTAESVDWNALLILTILVLGPFWLCNLIHSLSRRKSFGLFVSELGIGSRNEFDNTAIRWEHVEWIDVWIVDSKLYSIDIVGNKRKLYYKNPKKGERLTLEDLQRFLPEYESWTSYRSESWVEGITRYRRSPKD